MRHLTYACISTMPLRLRTLSYGHGMQRERTRTVCKSNTSGNVGYVTIYASPPYHWPCRGVGWGKYVPLSTVICHILCEVCEEEACRTDLLRRLYESAKFAFMMPATRVRLTGTDCTCNPVDSIAHRILAYSYVPNSKHVYSTNPILL